MAPTFRYLTSNMALPYPGVPYPHALETLFERSVANTLSKISYPYVTNLLGLSPEQLAFTVQLQIVSLDVMG